MDELLMEFMHGFYGYGNPKAKYWFIGLEEGGGENEQEINQRVNTWNNDGQPPLHPNIAEFHQAAGLPNWFADGAKIQRTWGRLSRLLLAAEGNQTIGRESVRDYQINCLGRDKLSCFLELYPMPSPNQGAWRYKRWFIDIPELASRRQYLECLRLHRIKGIQKLIDKHHPKVVVFYGFSEKQVWERIAKHEFRERRLQQKDYYEAVSRKPRYLIVQHPNARGITNAYYEAVGRHIRETFNGI